MSGSNRLLICSLIVIAVSSACSRSKMTVPEPGVLEGLGLIPIPDNQIIPDVRISTLDGSEDVLLSDFRGKVVLLNFWASWCPPCRAEMPAMERLAARLDGTDFVMLPVNVEEDRDLVRAFAGEFDLEHPLYLDPEGAAARTIGVQGLPTSVLIDRDGTALAAVIGALEWDSTEMLDMFLAWTR